jgi:single-stranded-DNA-specific exonuclease
LSFEGSASTHSNSNPNSVDSNTPPVLMPASIWQLLSKRGYRTLADIENLLNPKMKDLAHPFSIHDMAVAVQRLLAARQKQEQILIYGDYDLDGSPGVALLHDGLTRLGFRHLQVFQPERLKDGYGLHAHLMSEFQSRGVQLIVTVDVGITDFAAVDEARRLGLDVIITDHHLPKETLPNAHAIVNPNKGFCTSRLQHLCGAGVAFYLLLALKLELSAQKLIDENANFKELLDLFALATITDMVPLVAENRVLVKHGLKLLSSTPRPGLKNLFIELGLYGKDLTSQDISFRVAPKLNALTRLDQGLRALDVLMADAEAAPKRVQEMLLINERRRQLQSVAAQLARRELAQMKLSKNFIWIYSKEFHPGVISLLASDLMAEYNCPVYVGAEHVEGKLVCSARAPGESDNLQLSLGHATSLLNRFGGHKQAAGFEIELTHAEKFRERLNEYYEQFLNANRNSNANETQVSAISESLSALLENTADADIRLSDINATLMNWLDKLGPFGMGFEVPLFSLRDVKISSVKKLKGEYLKYNLIDDEGRTFEALWFNSPVLFEAGSRVRVSLELQWNDFNGRRSIQGLIRKMTIA